MKRNFYFQLSAVVSILILLVFVYGLFFADNPREIPSPQIGKPPHDFTVTTFDGQPISLGQFTGHPIILNFWASWCATCWKEAHILESTHQKYTPLGAVFIGIAINDQREASLRFIEKYRKTYLLAPDDTTGTIALNYGVTAVPETFLIDTKGIIKNKVLGAIENSVLEDFIRSELHLGPLH